MLVVFSPIFKTGAKKNRSRFRSSIKLGTTTFAWLKNALSGLRQFWGTESPLKMTKNAFYFTLKALSVLEVFKFLVIFLDFLVIYKNGLIRKIRLILKLKTSQPGKQTITIRSSLIYNTSARHERNEWDTSATQAARVRLEPHECDTSATRALHKRHECDTIATQTTRVRQDWISLILIMTRVKTYFHTPTFTIWQVKDYKETNNFILRTTFWKCLVPIPKCV